VATLFGFELKRVQQDKEEEKKVSFVEPDDDDGAITIAATGMSSGVFGSSYIDIDNAAKNEAELITKYRNMEQHQAVSGAIEDVVNEAIISNEEGKVVTVNLDDTDFPEKVKEKISEEFENILRLMDFSNRGYEIFNRWYVDGRLRYHVIIDEKQTKKGILELRYVDPRKLRRVKEVEKRKDKETDVILKKISKEYWVYNDKGFGVKKSTQTGSFDGNITGIKIAKDSVVEVTSGILNETNTLVLSHLHKAIKPYNQLRMLEDALVIYRLARAPERRVFYIDTGSLPKAKAEQYLRDMMVKHKNRLVYNSSSGEVRDDRRHMTMMEDFWLPRREGGRGTEITTLPGGQTLGEIDDVVYFQKELYKSLNVPISRMEPENGFSLGRASEITRDEVKFSRFVNRLRTRFSILFDEILEKQLVLKNVVKPEEWKGQKDLVSFDFSEDNHFEELKQAEILRERINTLDQIEPHIGVYYSRDWVRKNILMQTDEEIKEMDKEIEAAKKDEEEIATRKGELNQLSFGGPSDDNEGGPPKSKAQDQAKPKSGETKQMTSPETQNKTETKPKTKPKETV